MIYVLLANGFEQVEATVPMDILARGGFAIRTCGVTGRTITSTHGLRVRCDVVARDAKPTDMELLILPGGAEGVEAMAKSPDACRILDIAIQGNILIGAICAAPSFPGRLGYLDGVSYNCYPGYEALVKNGTHLPDKPVVRDGRFITAKAAGASFEFGFALLEALVDRKAAVNVAEKMYYSHTAY